VPDDKWPLSEDQSDSFQLKLEEPGNFKGGFSLIGLLVSLVPLALGLGVLYGVKTGYWQLFGVIALASAVTALPIFAVRVIKMNNLRLPGFLLSNTEFIRQKLGTIKQWLKRTADEIWKLETLKEAILLFVGITMAIATVEVVGSFNTYSGLIVFLFLVYGLGAMGEELICRRILFRGLLVRILR